MLEADAAAIQAMGIDRIIPERATFRSPARILLVSLNLGIAFDLLFWGKLLGLNVPLFVVILVGALVRLAREEAVPARKRNLWLLLPVFFFALMIVTRADPGLTVLNILALLFLLVLLAYFYAGGSISRLGLFGYWAVPIFTTGSALVKQVAVIRQQSEARAARAAGRRNAAPILRGAIMAFPVLLIFCALLASADAVFEKYVLAMVRLEFIFFIGQPLPQGALVLIVAWLLAGGFAFALGRRGAPDEESWEAGLATIPPNLPIGFIEASTVLMLVNALFAIFGLVQVTYLFGGYSTLVEADLTYAEYARRGFFELLTVSVLSMVLILGLHYLCRRDTPRQALLFKVFSTVMVAMVMLLLASAFWRMSLYEQAYGYTQLRLNVHTFEAWLALLYGWLLVTIWKRPRQFGLGAFLAVLGFLATLNLLNPGATIAAENLRHYRETGKLDISYLTALGEDAVPTLVQAMDTLPPEPRRALQSDLASRLRRMETDTRWQEVPQWHLSRWQAYWALSSRREILDAGAEIPPGAAILPPIGHGR